MSVKREGRWYQTSAINAKISIASICFVSRPHYGIDGPGALWSLRQRAASRTCTHRNRCYVLKLDISA